MSRHLREEGRKGGAREEKGGEERRDSIGEEGGRARGHFIAR